MTLRPRALGGGSESLSSAPKFLPAAIGHRQGVTNWSVVVRRAWSKIPMSSSGVDCLWLRGAGGEKATWVRIDTKLISGRRLEE